MAMIVLDTFCEEFIRERRAESGVDRFDEVWDGEYVVTPLRDVDHQALVSGVSFAIAMAFGFNSPEQIRPGTYITDNVEDQLHNYRCVDVALFLPNTSAKLIDPCWYGGPDFACEITSPNDQTPARFQFLERVGTRELLIVDRDPWQLELFRLVEGKLISVATSTIDNRRTLASDVIPFTFKLEAGETRPQILLRHTESDQSWRV